MFIPCNDKGVERAKKLRREMTKEERKLWYEFLKNYPIKVRKQKPIGTYIVDFFCDAARLVIELDGSQHYEDRGLEWDAMRTKYLESLGLMVVRYSNREINMEFRAVCENIDRLIRERVQA